MSTRAETTVSVELVRGRARATVLDGGQHIRPRMLDVDGPRMRLALVATCATLLAGDDVRLRITIGSGAAVELVEPSGTVAYDARGGHASWSGWVVVEAGGSFVWRAAPFVVAGGASVTRDTRLDLADGAAALLEETVVLGRSGETGGAVTTRTRATHAGRELLVEDVELTCPGRRSMPGALGAGRVLATAALLGVDVDPATMRPERETRLHGPGVLARAVAQHAHETEAALAPSWSRWHRLLAADRNTITV